MSLCQLAALVRRRFSFILDALWNGLPPALLAILVLLVAGCGEEKPTGAPPGPLPVPAPPVAAAEARRVVAFAPSVVEYLYAMGEQKRIVGVSDWCVYPPEAKQQPVLGSAVQPDLEKMLAAKPDLILGIGKSEKLVELGAANGFRVEALHVESLADVLAAPQKIAGLIGAPGRGKGLYDRLAADLAAVESICKKRTATPRVLVFTGDGDARFTIGKGSFLTDLVGLCGGDCVTKSLAKPWPTIGLEELVNANPDVILMLQASDEVSAEKRQACVDRWKEYPDFPAVKNNRIVVLTGSHLLIGGPRISVTALDFAKAIHPELFAAGTSPAGSAAPAPAPAAVPAEGPAQAPVAVEPRP